MAKFKFKVSPEQGRTIVLDTETTGLSPKYGDRICEIAAVEIVDGKLTGNVFHRYINPECEVSPEAEAVHGLSNRFLSDKPVFAQIVEEFISFMVSLDERSFAHNASFDARFITAELARCGYPAMGNLQCSLKLARAVLGKGSRDLATLAGFAGVTFGGRGAHSAISDTRVLANVLLQLLWPYEHELAVDPEASLAMFDEPAAPQKPSQRRKTKSKPKPKAPVVKQVISLPVGFKTLAAGEDPRICRYDDFDVDHLITARGKRWTFEEEQNLATAFVDRGEGIINLVEQHGRTPAAIFLKLEAIGVIDNAHPYNRVR
jgi:DNA polymerase-3 subunit epsilon